MKTIIIILAVVATLALAGMAVFLLLFKSPDLSSYLPLREPRIVKKERERVLEVKFSGDATTVIKEAYSVLFKAFYSLKGVPKGGPDMKPPKARYQFKIDLSQSATERLKAIANQPWTGSVAIPVPAGTVLPDAKPGAGGYKAELADWEYGEVAEILHLGSYETEPPTIEKLEVFIKAQGYTVIGDHEEEYLKGPGMAIVKPADYWTIIRYRIKK